MSINSVYAKYGTWHDAEYNYWKKYYGQYNIINTAYTLANGINFFWAFKIQRHGKIGNNDPQTQ